MLTPKSRKKLTIEVKQEKEKFFAIIWQDDTEIRKSDYFNTAAGASVAGYLLLSESESARSTQLLDARSRAAI